MLPLTWGTANQREDFHLCVGSLKQMHHMHSSCLQLLLEWRSGRGEVELSQVFRRISASIASSYHVYLNRMVRVREMLERRMQCDEAFTAFLREQAAQSRSHHHLTSSSASRS